METKEYARKEVGEDGTVWYYDEKGDLHREDGPALERADGAKAWYRNGKRHREDGPAIEDADGTKVWYRNGERHREDGPAIEYPNGTTMWYRNGLHHRDDGPAIEYPDGTKEYYWLSGKQMTEEEFRVLHPEVFASSEVVEEESPGPGH